MSMAHCSGSSRSRQPSPAKRYWLLRIAHNLVIDRARRQSRARIVPLGDAASDGKDTGAVVVDRLQLLRALQNLSDDDREVVSLRAAGLQFAEVAAVIGKTEPAARMAWHRAARRLREQLER
jgi:RNA polymerase sigma factor (sigma-70 family)